MAVYKQGIMDSIWICKMLIVNKGIKMIIERIFLANFLLYDTIKTPY